MYKIGAWRLPAGVISSIIGLLLCIGYILDDVPAEFYIGLSIAVALFLIIGFLLLFFYFYSNRGRHENCDPGFKEEKVYVYETKKEREERLRLKEEKKQLKAAQKENKKLVDQKTTVNKKEETKK